MSHCSTQPSGAARSLTGTDSCMRSSHLSSEERSRSALILADSDEREREIEARTVGFRFKDQPQSSSVHSCHKIS